ncbi:uncharacterized protein LOC116428470 [Nomia melanderi]|uniref:uncharacterized protein LOC116428470 n=1 Tax=Nomia melanderi TaxID=2448451 RepID=UPI003FCE3667
MSLVQRLDINKFFKKREKPGINNSKNTEPGKNNENSIVVDTLSKSNMNIEIKDDAKKEENMEEVVADVAEVRKDKSLTNIAIKNLASNPPSTNVEEPKKTISQELPKMLSSQGIIKKDSPPVRGLKPKEQKDIGNQEKKKPDVSKPKVQKEKAAKTRDTEECITLKKDSATVCTQCTRQKLPTKEPRQREASRCVSREIEPQTVCTNLIFPVRTNEEKERAGDSRCNCRCLPPSPRCSRVSNYPKSCLKKERQFYRMDSQEIPASCQDNRSWEECGCRRIVFCENCCRPRNECSCRPVVPCATCCKPKLECVCNTVCTSSNHYRHLKSMVCLYCDRPRDSCACRSPMRKCSCCELAVDLCRCDENRETFRDGRQVPTEPDNDRTMYVTAWKPREDVRRYFSRNLEDLGRDAINECRCHEKLRAQNSDDLPYQRLSCFSDVMNELQQKMSESVCCTQCRKIPCCCGVKVDEGRDERKIKYCVSPKSRRKVVAVCVEKPRSKSPTICKCDPQSRGDRQKKIVVCCHCKSSPCRCKRTPKPKKPRMKCYYCKNSPCVCIASRERGKPRPCRCADSPCRAKEKEITVCGKTSTKPKNNEEKIVCVR